MFLSAYGARTLSPSRARLLWCVLFFLFLCDATTPNPRVVRFSVDSEGTSVDDRSAAGFDGSVNFEDPSDFFATSAFKESGGGSDISSSSSFSELPVSAADGLHFAYSGVRVRDQSQYFISARGVPLERFYNQVKFVYKAHDLPNGHVAVALTPVSTIGSVIATTSSGKLFLRHARTPAGDLVWTDITPDGHHIIGGGHFYQSGVNAKNLCFFVSAQGDLLEYDMLPMVSKQTDHSHKFTVAEDFQRGVNWKVLGHPVEGGLVGVSAVFHIVTNRPIVVCVSAFNQVIFFENQRWKTIAHEPPKAPARTMSMPAATVASSSHDHAPMMLFFLGDDGSAYGLVKAGKEWVYEQHPCCGPLPADHTTRFVSAPSKGVLRGSIVSVYFVSNEGQLFERTIDLRVQKRWKWVNHGHPPNTFLGPAPPLVTHGTEIVCRTHEGALARLVLWGFVWRWLLDTAPMMILPNRLVTVRVDETQAIPSGHEDTPSPLKESCGKDENCQWVENGGYCVRSLISLDGCMSGMDPMGIIPAMKMHDAYEAVSRAKEQDRSLFGLREVEVKNITFQTDSPVISYTVNPNDKNAKVYENNNWGNRLVPPTAIVARTVELFSPERIGVEWDQAVDSSYAAPDDVSECDVQSLLEMGGLAMTPSKTASVGSRASFALAGMAENSIFIISPGGLILERFWNQANWVYVQHSGLPDDPIVQVTTIVRGGTLFVSNTKGVIFQRMASGFSSPLIWKPVPHRGSKFFHGGVVSAVDPNEVYFLDHRGRLLLRLVQQQRWETAFKEAPVEMWVKDLKHRSYSLPLKSQNILFEGSTVTRGQRMIDLAVMISADDLTTGLFFALDVNSELWEYSTWLHRWTWHGYPEKGTSLRMQPAAVLPDSTAIGSLFFATSDGSIVERYFNQFGGHWMWVDHGSPPSAKVAGPPGATLFNNRIHVVGTDGHLWALVFRIDEDRGDGWKWVDCGLPGIPLAIMRPVRISTYGVGLLAFNGKFAIRRWRSELDLWEWSLAELPEGSSIGSPPGTSYCSPEPMSPMNCVRGNKGVAAIDLTNPNSEMFRELEKFTGPEQAVLTDGPPIDDAALKRVLAEMEKNGGPIHVDNIKSKIKSLEESTRSGRSGRARGKRKRKQKKKAETSSGGLS